MHSTTWQVSNFGKNLGLNTVLSKIFCIAVTSFRFFSSNIGATNEGKMVILYEVLQRRGSIFPV